VRIHKTVQTREVLVDEPLLQEVVVVERVPVNRVVEGPIPVRYEGDTITCPCWKRCSSLRRGSC
jgi:hypothetical protein